MSDNPAISLEALSAALSGIIAATSPSVVSVHSRQSLSCGFAWRPDLIVTADEALAEEGEIAVTITGGERRPALIVGRDPTTDIAVLRIEGGGLKAVTLAPQPLHTGALAVTVGAMDGCPLSAFGIVALVGPAWRSMRGGDIEARIELDLRLRRQAEGSVVLDAGGRAFGMAVFGPHRRTLVIPAAAIERVASRLVCDGRIPRGYLGLGLQPVRIEGDGTRGAMIMNVDSKGPGATAGCRQGDVIVTWNSQPFPGVGELLRALGPDSVGQSITVGLRRGGAPIGLTLTIGERPQD